MALTSVLIIDSNVLITSCGTVCLYNESCTNIQPLLDVNSVMAGVKFSLFCTYIQVFAPCAATEPWFDAFSAQKPVKVLRTLNNPG